MTEVKVNGKTYDFDTVVSLMDDEIRELVHNEITDSLDEQGFVDAYMYKHKKILEEEFVIN